MGDRQMLPVHSRRTSMRRVYDPAPVALDPRTPVIVGVGQTLRRPETLEGVPEPAEMMIDALRLAADDASPGARLLEAADSIRVVELLSWRYANPGALLAERLG